MPSAWQRKPTTFLNLPKPRISKLLYPRAPRKTARESLSWSKIQQAKDTYESSLKNIIEECISLETSILQSQENETIYTLLASIVEAINTLEGLKTDVHQKVISLIYLDCSFISYTTSTSRTPLSPAIVPITTWKPSQPLQSIHYRLPTLRQMNVIPNSSFTQSRCSDTKIMACKHSAKPSKVLSLHPL